MGRRLSIDVSQLLDNLEDGFLDAPEAMLILSALSLAADRISEDVPPGLSVQQGRRWLIQKALALVGVTEEPPPASDEEADSQDEVDDEEVAPLPPPPQDDTELVARAIDDATMQFWGLGTVPLILVFSTDERKELGDTPLEHLKVLLGAALVGDRNALEEANTLVQKLAEGAQMRSWFEPPEYRIARELFGVPEEE
jgi:hypothetical protein